MPRRHNVSGIVRSLIKQERFLSPGEIKILSGYLDAFETIARIRGDAGYSYESAVELEGFKEIYGSYAEDVSGLLDFVSDISGRSRQKRELRQRKGIDILFGIICQRFKETTARLPLLTLERSNVFCFDGCPCCTL